MTTGERKKKKRSKGGKPQRPSGKPGTFRALARRGLFVLGGMVALGLLALVFIYLFAPLDRRTQVERFAAEKLYSIRLIDGMPDFARTWMARLEDQLPGSEGFAIDSGEVARGPSHFLAGIPHSRESLKRISNNSYLNLYHPGLRQPVCVGLRLTKETTGESFEQHGDYHDDPRVATRSSRELRQGGRTPQPLAPPAALTSQHGDIGLKEAHLRSNLVAMPKDFADKVWRPLVHTLSQRYPKRFGEIWLCLGPVFSPSEKGEAPGEPRAEAFFAIVFDETEAGALRAISFLVPVTTENSEPQFHLSSIQEIESRAGLQFLPELRPHNRQSLSNWRSPRLW